MLNSWERYPQYVLNVDFDTMTKYLLKGGTIATSVQGSHEAHVFKADVLVEDTTITRIEENIAPGSGVEVIDCQDKWITPGFIDTHRYASSFSLSWCFHILTCTR